MDTAKELTAILEEVFSEGARPFFTYDNMEKNKKKAFDKAIAKIFQMIVKAGKRGYEVGKRQLDAPKSHRMGSNFNDYSKRHS